MRRHDFLPSTLSATSQSRALIRTLAHAQDRLRFNGPTCDTKRTANTLNVSIKGVNASLLLLELKVWAILLRYIPLVRGCPDAALVQTSDMACFARVRC